MDNFRFSMTCEGDKTLASALGLVWQARGLDRVPPLPRPDYKKPGATHYAIRPGFAGERGEVPVGAPKYHNPDWKYDKEPKPLRLVFYDNRYKSSPPEGGDQVALPFTLDAAGAADFASRWLAEVDYGNEPDHDGDNGKGWTVYNEAWGHVDGHYSAIIAIAPTWAMYGK
jgi:hypothetical protein